MDFGNSLTVIFSLYSSLKLYAFAYVFFELFLRQPEKFRGDFKKDICLINVLQLLKSEIFFL